MSKWQSTETSLPTWEDGEVLLMLPDSRIVRGRYNDYHKKWWHKKDRHLLVKLNEQVRYWKPINQT